jgi:hypothetical protein
VAEGVGAAAGARLDGARAPDPAGGFGKAVVIDHQRPLAAAAVRVGEDVLVNAAVLADQVKKLEAFDLSEGAPPAQQREELALVAADQRLVRLLGPAGAVELHAVLLGQALDLAVAEHRQPGQRRHQGRDAEVLAVLAELVEGGALVGIGHEVDVPLEDPGVELEGAPDEVAVVGIALVAQHVHEGRVVDPVHAEGAHEVALEQPEGLGQQQGVRGLGRHPVDHLPPELLGHRRVELGAGHAVPGPRRDVAAGPRLRKPEPVEVPLGERHGGVETDHR